MKRLLLLITICISSVSFGQDTYVPDDSFELLLETYYGASNGTPNDNYVSTAVVESIQLMSFSPSLIPSGMISDFTGIEAFTDLHTFSIQGMNMIDVDLSALTIVPSGGLFDFQLAIQNCNLLQNLTMPHGGGIQINISNCVSLVNINYHSDNILEGSSIIGQCPSLTSYDISMVSSVKLQSQIWLANNGQLQCVNLKNGYCSNWASVGVTGSPLLNCIEVDDPNYCNISEGTTWNSQINGVPIYSTNCNNSCSGSLGISELNSNQSKELVRIVNLLGQETPYQPNTVLIYQYSDGTSEKVFTIED